MKTQGKRRPIPSGGKRPETDPLLTAPRRTEDPANTPTLDFPPPGECVKTISVV